MAKATARQTDIQIAKDPATGVERPHYVVRAVVVDSVVMFKSLTGAAPTVIHVPPMLEAALQIDHARSLDLHGKIRETHGDELFGCRPVWDAETFKLE